MSGEEIENGDIYGESEIDHENSFFEMETESHGLYPVVRGAVYFLEFRYSNSIIASDNALRIGLPTSLRLIASLC